MIRLGPAGIPTVCKGSSLEGMKCVKQLGLHAMEIEFVHGVKMSNSLAKKLGETAKELNIELSIHAPYYINLASKDKIKISASKKRILDSLERGHFMGARTVAIHAGYYGGNKEFANKLIEDACKELAEKIKKNSWNVLIGLETTGRQSQWGTLDEIIYICKKNDKCVPVVDFAHIYARNGGRINYKEVFEKLKPLKLNSIHSHFSGINYSVIGIGKGNERNHLPIKSRQPDFKELAREIIKRRINITIISESPILEQDSLLMKKTFEELGYRFKNVI